MSSSNSTSIEAINDIKRKAMLIVQIWSICLVVLGSIGHTLNIYIFTRSKFRHNPCIRYFLASAVSGYLVVCFTVPLRMLQITYNMDVFTYSASLCQFLTYIFSCLRVAPAWFITFASIDRFLCSSSSVTLRSWSTIRVANRTIIVLIICIALAYSHLPFVYTLLLPQRVCSYTSSFYQGVYSIWNLVFWGWIPTLCMFTFGFLIIGHIQQGRRRVVPQNLYQRTQRKKDLQLLQMLFIQSFALVSTTTTLSAGILYISVSNSLRVKNDLEKTTDTYLQNVFNYIGVSGPCMSFYLFTLSSGLFRRELLNLFHR